jgi:RND family efflux transporter MFP subunit
MDKSALDKRTLAMAVGVFALAVGCSSRAGTTVEAAGEPAQAVAVERVKRQDMSRSLELAAEFRPYQEVDLHAKIPGYLKAIHVDVGDRAAKGQLIAELEAPEMAQDLAQASATLKRTRLEVERARSEVHRSEALDSIRQVSYERLSGVMKARPNLVAQQEIDDSAARQREAAAQLASAQAALAAAEEQVRIAEATKERLETMLAYLRITAPFAGIITSRMADPGAMIQAGTASHVQAMPVVRLSEVDHLRLVLPVPESAVSRVRVQAPVEVRVESLSRVFQGKISRFTGKLDQSTRTMDTEVDLPNPDFVIKPGMFGYATFVLDRKLDALSVPVQALAGRGPRASVLIVNPAKRLELRELSLGLETPSRVEVLSGLSGNEMVVIGSRSNLRAGLAVEPKLQDARPQGTHN